MDIEKKARELLAVEYERDGHLGVAHTLRYGYALTQAQDKALAAIASALRSAQAADAERLDWLDSNRGDDVAMGASGEPELRGHYWVVDGQFHDVRAAIDAARGKA